ncbi:MAG: hypothetical protein ACLGHP_04460, partial [Vicinamibacteria bacterium]
HYCEWIRGWTHTCLEIYGELAARNPGFLRQFDDAPAKSSDAGVSPKPAVSVGAGEGGHP